MLGTACSGIPAGSYVMTTVSPPATTEGIPTKTQRRTPIERVGGLVWVETPSRPSPCEDSLTFRALPHPLKLRGALADQSVNSPNITNPKSSRSILVLNIISRSLVSGVPGKPPLRHWDPSSTPWFQDYSADGDEDNAIYKSE